MDAVIITVRLKSTRLKRKVLRSVENKFVLKYLTDRLKRNFKGIIIICTSINSEDDPLVEFAKNENLDYFRGSEEDVLDRYLETMIRFNIDRAYIVYGDEPFTDIDTMNLNFSLLDSAKSMWIKNDSLPEGTYGYGITRKGLEYINRNKPSDNLEVWQLMADKLPLKKIELNTELREYYENYRFTIDYPEDLEVFERIIKTIKFKHITISLPELIKLYDDLKLYDINGFRIKEYEARIQSQGKQYLIK